MCENCSKQKQDVKLVQSQQYRNLTICEIKSTERRLEQESHLKTCEICPNSSKKKREHLLCQMCSNTTLKTLEQ